MLCRRALCSTAVHRATSAVSSSRWVGLGVVGHYGAWPTWPANTRSLCAAAATQVRHFSDSSGSQSGSGSTRRDAVEDDDEFEFDATLSIRKEAAVHNTEKNFDAILAQIFPLTSLPPAAVEKLRVYLAKYPIDGLIVEPQVQITHVEDSETGKEQRVSLSVCDIADALESAKAHGMQLVQMGAANNVAFCRIRREEGRLRALIEEDLKNAKADGEGGGAAAGARESGDCDVDAGDRSRREKLLELKEHQFRDVVDAHFVGWRSKKIVEDLRRCHPVKVCIREFQNPGSALSKLREMCKAIEAAAQGGADADSPLRRQKKQEPVYHFFTSIVANDRECSVTFSPALQGKVNATRQIKHPGEKEWASAEKRMDDACRKSGRFGTYVKANTLRPRSLGQTMYRVDKYGRRLD